MADIWEIKLFGWLRATRGNCVVSRFPTRKCASLLAALAYNIDRPHSREVLTEMLWPDADPQAARNRFRVALSSLRALLEPDGVPAGTVLIADRSAVGLSAAEVTTDVREFEATLAAAGAASGAEREAWFARAEAFYTADLLTGHYDEWIVPERERLALARLEALCGLAIVRQELGDIDGAIDACQRAVAADGLREDAHQRLMSLYLAKGDTTSALRQYRDLRRKTRRGIGQPPSPAARALAESIRARLRDKSPPPAQAGAPDPMTRIPHQPPAGAPPRLPSSLTSFFGRDGETARLVALLSGGETRLVTLSGSGGSGKTRLAVEVARLLEPAYADAVWFVPLAERFDARLIIDAIFDAMRLRRLPGTDPKEQVISALASRPSLMVLDNFEHLVPDGVAVVRDLLERAPTLRCLVTSQVRLQLSGEREIPLAPLAIPILEAPPDRLLDCPSVLLFVDRAQAVLPGFEVNERNARAVSEICRRLEGIPLAIELAAAWAHTLTPTQMIARLSSRFDLLVARDRDVFDRHRALRTTVDWSYELLPVPLRRFFTRLSVFHNGWTLDAAEYVCQEPDTLDHIAALKERSFLVAEEQCAEMAFSMLATLHDYAAQHLPDAESAVLARRHAEYYLDLSLQAEPALRGDRMEEWLERLECAHGNIFAALAYSLGPTGNPEVAARLAAALAMFWEHRGRLREGRHFLTRALAQVVEPSVRLRALNAASRLAVVQGDAIVGADHGAEALWIARDLGDEREQALALRNLAYVDFIRADYTHSIALQELSLALFRKIDDKWGMAASMDDLGSVVTRTGDYERARALMEEALALYREIGHREGQGSALYGLGVVERDLLDYTSAREYLTQTLAVAEELKDVQCIALAATALGSVAALSGDAREGGERISQGITLFRELGDSRGLFVALYHLGATVERRTDPEAAVATLREGLQLANKGGDPRYTLYSLDALGLVAADMGQLERAARLLGKGEAYRVDLGYPWPPYILDDRERTLSGVRAALPPEALDRQWREGASMSLEDAIRYASR
ncbi:MAG TPA: tetratricopeptide repeat protein [Armatimonadota bacterium]|jgi:predicted ATPase/DNA-binding SARP family transcriptional activator/predicted RNase H-like HicB family nuclease